MKAKVQIRKDGNNLVIEVVKKAQVERIFERPFTGYDDTWFTALDTAFAKAKEIGRKTIDTIGV